MSDRTVDYATMSLLDAEADAQAMARDVVATFGALDAKQLNWKPEAARWSVAQCFDHLLQSNSAMIGAMERALDRRVPRKIWQRLPVLPGLLGPFLVRSLSPDGRRAFKASIAIPAASAIDADIISRFAASQSLLQDRFREFSNHDVARVMVLSPFASVVAYSLLDSCRIIVTHQRRHFEQARRVTEWPEFPAAAPR